MNRILSFFCALFLCLQMLQAKHLNPNCDHPGTYIGLSQSAQPGVYILERADGMMMNKTTFIVDTRGISLNPNGMFFAGDFLFNLPGLSNWSPYAMCNIGNGLWSITFINIPSGNYQYKFLNGTTGWEFDNGMGGPCTNPADNNNRTFTATGGNQTIGPFCWNVCAAQCPGFGPTSGSDNVPPVITGSVPGSATFSCGSTPPPGSPLPADDNCDVNATTTTGMPVDVSSIGPCGIPVITRTWTAIDCSGNTTAVTQILSGVDNDPPYINTTTSPVLNVTCGNVPPAVALAASDACDNTLTSTGLPVDQVSGTCTNRVITRRWTATDCSGNRTTRTQVINVTDNTPPTISGAVPANTTVACGALPVGVALVASDLCDPAVTSTGMPTDNTSGLNACGVGTVVRVWTATDCAGNSRTVSQTITVQDAIPPVLNVPANSTLSCSNLPPATAADASATDNCSTTPVIEYLGQTTSGTTCPYTIIRAWRATDCSGNSSTKTQAITVSDTQPPTFSNIPADKDICQGTPNPMVSLTWNDNCDGTGTVLGTDVSNNQTNPEVITRTWTYTDACGNVATATQTIRVFQPATANAGADISSCGAQAVNISGVVVGGFTNAQWTTSGSGVFANPMSGATTYTPSAADLAAGSVQLTFTGSTTGSACPASSDALIVSFGSSVVAQAGTDQTLNCGQTSVILGATSAPGVTYSWAGPGINAGNQNISNPQVTLPGTYTLTVSTTNSSGLTCTASDQVVVNQVLTPANANAGADQLLSCTSTSVQLQGTGTPGGTFVWAGPGINASNANTPTPTVSEIGTYTLTVTHPVSQCTASDQVIVTKDNDLPAADAGQDQFLTCITNQVTLNGAGSASGAGISYQWLSPSGTSLGSALTQSVSQAGIYQLIVTNSITGCSSSASVAVVDSSAAPMAMAGADQEITCTVTSVTLGIMPTQPTGITYVWTRAGSAVGNTAQISVQSAGTYQLVVTNTFTGCTNSDQVVVVSNNTPPTANAGPDLQLSCAVTSVRLSGVAIPNGAYLWTGPNNFNAQVIDPIVSAPGTYTLVVTNTQNGCTAVDQTIITASSGLPTAVAGPDTSLNCIVAQITLSASGSSTGANITYGWTNAAGANLGSASMITVNTAGIYTLVVTDTQSGCTSTDQVVVTSNISQPTANAGSDVVLTCAQPSAQLSGLGSTPATGLAYTWTGPSIVGNANQATITVGGAGTYTLVVTNIVNQCTASDQVSVTQDPNIPIANAGTNVSITSCTNPQAILQGGGTGAQLSYRWSGPGINATNQSQQNPLVTVIGTYTLVVTSAANGCTSAPAQVQVLDGRTLPVVQATQQGILGCSNQVTLSGAGSATGAGITYQWLTSSGQAIAGATSITYSTNQAGRYILRVTDTNTGCVGFDTLTLNVNATLPSVSVAQQGVLGCANSSVTLSGAGSSTGPDIRYQWTQGNGTPITGATAINHTVSQPGVYVLVVIDVATGCSVSQSLTVVVQGNLPQANINSTNTTLTCNITSLTLTTQPPATGLTLNWSTIGGSLSGNTNGTTITVNSPGQYLLNVTDPTTQCIGRDTVIITSDLSKPQLSIGNEYPLTCDQTSVSLPLVATGSSSGFTYNWVGPSGFTSQLSTPVVSVSGRYTVVVTHNGTGCRDTTSTVVVQSSGISDVEYTAVSPTCRDSVLTGSLIITDVQGGTAPFVYSIDGVSFGTNMTFSNLAAGDYTLIVRDASGCRSVRPFTIFAPDIILVDLGQDLEMYPGDSVRLTATGSPDITSYTWTPSFSLSCADCNAPYAKPASTTTYIVTVKNDQGCSATDTVIVRVRSIAKDQVYTPSAFGPSQEYPNDFFMIYTGPQVNEIKYLRIFDRWGDLVFYKEKPTLNDPTSGWDGRYKGKLMLPGVYIYDAEVFYSDGFTQQLSGSVTLIR